MKREHLSNFNLAGFTYYDGPFCFKKLKIGKKLKLVLEPNNPYDSNAVAIYYKEHKLGFIPKTENKFPSKLLRAGLNCLEAVVQRKDAAEHPENQIQIVLYLVNKSLEPQISETSE